MQNQKQTTWENYVLAWKEPSAHAKASKLHKCVAGDCVYTDPVAVAKGHDELVAYMFGFQQQVPGGHFVTTYFQAHHDMSVAKWNMVNGEGSVIGDGISLGHYNEQGSLVAMTGFFETPPQ